MNERNEATNGIFASFVLAIEDQTLPRVTPLSVLSPSRGQEEERPGERGNQKDLGVLSAGTILRSSRMRAGMWGSQ